MYFRILKKYLSAYIFPIFKKANVISTAKIQRKIIILASIGIWIKNIPTEIAPTIKYNICLKDK